ncbi:MULTISPECIES: LysR family transcriptional regulator [Cellvibrio]|uniref:DNA-binding transcriptional LysR family regulator n=1 Tax=Cellvibrio fibrivorans TaxID=126350 RepID=A0ABU1V2T9_9GAMM|nr:LysR family transcriptional regulator [Cellvibrio fibrivorans]MDR7091767.1 DNA-binding transcriptional LysR family regulator [Cellvibrio fibrivorans]
MEIYQLKTFVTIASEGTITRASELLFLSQPAVSAHIKTIEDEVGFLLFERTARGMRLTDKGAALLVKAEQLLALHRELIQEARQLKGRVGGKVRLGSNRGPSALVLGKLLTSCAEKCPDIDVQLVYGSSAEIEQSILTGALDVGFFADSGRYSPEILKLEVDKFGVYLAAPTGWVTTGENPDWQQLATMPWICPASNSCCGKVAEQVFVDRGFRPQKQVSVDHEKVTRTLIAGGVGVGFLHADTALEAQAKGELVLLGDVQQYVSVFFGMLRGREQEPLIGSVLQVLEDILQQPDAYTH